MNKERYLSRATNVNKHCIILIGTNSSVHVLTARFQLVIGIILKWSNIWAWVRLWWKASTSATWKSSTFVSITWSVGVYTLRESLCHLKRFKCYLSTWGEEGNDNYVSIMKTTAGKSEIKNSRKIREENFQG